MDLLHPDLVLHGGRISTMDGDGPEGGRVVSALAARDGRIMALGDDDAVLALAGPATERVDLAGARAIPGIVESHAHPDSYAARIRTWEDVSPAHIGSRDALLDRIAQVAAAKGPDDWIVCYRFDDQKSGGYPSLDEMDAAANGRPLYIQRTDGHVGLANSRAFEAVGLGGDPADPPFGAFDRDPSGRLTGRCRETAAHVFLSHVHAGDTEDMLAGGLAQVFEEWRALGITTVYNSLCGSRSIAAYQRLKEEGRLGMRVGIIVSGREEGLVEAFVASGIRSGFGDDLLRVIGVEWCP
ncbi:MAG: amidohydrolase family protein, partial [Pseudomonadota bacterium]